MIQELALNPVGISELHSLEVYRDALRSGIEAVLISLV